MPTPDQSQATRPISFIYHNLNNANGTNGRAPKEMTLTIRPEELTRTDTSRLTTHHTLGGAFADSFGKAIPTVQIAGHTGWGQGTQQNGLDTFIALHQFIYEQWHRDRATAVNTGLDPDHVKLLFHDQLDQFTWVVAPASFVLKRNKSNPLLSYYQINLTWLSSDVKETLDALEQSRSSGLGGVIDSWQASLDTIDKLADDAIKGINDFLGPVHEFIGKAVALTAKISHSVLSVIQSGNNITNAATGNLFSIASGLTQATGNIMAAVSAVANIPESLKAKAMLLRSAFLNLFCLLKNTLNPARQLPVYDIYGASLCSSTAGGSPPLTLLGTNTFERVLQGVDEQYTVSRDAENKIRQLAAVDPLNPPSLGVLNAWSTDVVKGVK